MEGWPPCNATSAFPETGIWVDGGKAATSPCPMTTNRLRSLSAGFYESTRCRKKCQTGLGDRMRKARCTHRGTRVVPTGGGYYWVSSCVFFVVVLSATFFLCF